MTEPEIRRDRRAALKQNLAGRYANLERRRSANFVIAVARRYLAIDGSVYAGLMAVELFTTILPLIIIGFGYISGFAASANVGNLFVRVLGVHGSLESTVRGAFGTADGLHSSWTIAGMATFLFWGIPMSITVAGIFARAWRREAFPIGQRLGRGAIWFVLYLVTLVLRDRIAFAGHHALPLRLGLYAVSLVPALIFWTYTPALLVRDGGRGFTFLVRAGLAGVLIDGIALSLPMRLFFPAILAGWAGFGSIGVAMALMTWCGVLGIGWVLTACVGAVLWERAAPPDVVIAAQTPLDATQAP